MVKMINVGKDPINEVWVHCILLFQKPVLRNEACHKTLQALEAAVDVLQNRCS